MAETKLANVEESLDRLRRQQEWLRRYNEVQLTLGQEKVRLYELNKQMSSLIDDENALRRFESFEAVQPTFLRMRLLERAAAQNRRNRQSLSIIKHKAKGTAAGIRTQATG